MTDPADGNYPASTTLGPNAELVSSNLRPDSSPAPAGARRAGKRHSNRYRRHDAAGDRGAYAMSGDPPVWTEFRQDVQSRRADGRTASRSRNGISMRSVRHAGPRAHDPDRGPGPVREPTAVDRRAPPNESGDCLWRAAHRDLRRSATQFGTSAASDNRSPEETMEKDARQNRPRNVGAQFRHSRRWGRSLAPST